MSIVANDVGYSGPTGAPSNVTFTGPWIPMNGVQSIGFQALVAGTGNPTGTWGVDITDDEDPTRPFMGATPLTPTADMIANNPAGAGVAINHLFMFDPAPRCKFMRLNLVSGGGGSATLGSLKIAVNRKGIL